MPEESTAADQRAVFRLVDQLEQQLRALEVPGEAIDLVLLLRRELTEGFAARSGETPTPCAP